jgi:hypothetical protein
VYKDVVVVVVVVMMNSFAGITVTIVGGFKSP